MNTSYKRVLITGSNGMLGKDLVSVFSSDFEVYGLNRKIDEILGSKNSIICDMTSKADFVKALLQINFDLIVHTAALVDIEFCEKNPVKCKEANFEVVKNIVDAAHSNTYIIFISTDSVFDDNIFFPSEDSLKNPLNCYAKTKSLAEDYIINNHKNHMIVRTNMYGFHKNWRGSLVEWAISKLESGNSFGGYTDVHFNPLYTKQLSKAIFDLIEKDYYGVIHLGSSESITKYDFLVMALSELGFDSRMIYKTKLENENAAPRPKHTSLGIKKSKDILTSFDFSLVSGIMQLKEDLGRFRLNDRNQQK